MKIDSRRTSPGLSSRMLLGAIAGSSATMAMTATMRRFYALLPPEERYPLPPREITERLIPALRSDEAIKDAAMAAHHAYGAIGGALLAAVSPTSGPGIGVLAGVSVWVGSYMGWLPATNVLIGAWHHPARRNVGMIAAHLVWGAATGAGYRELTAARTSVLSRGPLKDTPAREKRICRLWSAQ